MSRVSGTKGGQDYFLLDASAPLQHRVARKWAGVIYSLPLSLLPVQPWEKSPSTPSSVFFLGGCDDEWMTIWPEDLFDNVDLWDLW